MVTPIFVKTNPTGDILEVGTTKLKIYGLVLLALEKEGKVQRVVPDDRSGRPHYWRYINNEPIDLESMF